MSRDGGSEMKEGRREGSGGHQPTAMSSSSFKRPVYISSDGSLAKRPSILRQVEDFFLSLWEFVVLFFKTLLEVSSALTSSFLPPSSSLSVLATNTSSFVVLTQPSTDTSRVGKRASAGKGAGWGGGGGPGGGGGKRFKDMSSSSGPSQSSSARRRWKGQRRINC